jgi:hypothetical protein
VTSLITARTKTSGAGADQQGRRQCPGCLGLVASARSGGKRNSVRVPAMKMMAVKSRNACSIEGNAGVDGLNPSLNEGASAVSAPAAL